MQDYPLRSVTIDFHGSQLITIEKDGTIYVAMKLIVEGMGLDWGTQYRKLIRNKEKFNCCHMTMVHEDGKLREMLCLPLTKLNGWFFSVNPLKVRPGIRKMVSLYQEECFVALYDYWHKGAAINPRAFSKNNSEPDSLRDITIKLLTDETDSAFDLLRKYVITGNEGQLEIKAIFRFRLGTDPTESLGMTELVASDKSEEYLTPTELGRQIGCSAKKINKLLLENGLQVSFRNAKGDLCYEPTEKGVPYAVFKDAGKKPGKTKGKKQRLLWKKSVIILIS